MTDLRDDYDFRDGVRGKYAPKTFTVWPVPDGRTHVDHIKTHMRDWLLSFAPERADTLSCSPIVASYVDILDDFEKVDPDDTTTLRANEPVKVGRWRRWDVYVDPICDPGYGAFLIGLSCNMDAAFRLEGA